MTATRQKKLNEKELGSLYLLSETPLITDRLLKAGQYSEADITSFHETLSGHAPDMAMIAISLSGNMIAEAMKQSNVSDIVTLGVELKHLSVNTLEEVGRIWIDACRYNVASEDDIHDIVHQSADILCMFTSIFMDVAEIITNNSGPDILRALSAALMYQCEAHADSARSILDNATPKLSKTSIDAIPIPAELQGKTYSDNVVTFSLFGEQKTH